MRDQLAAPCSKSVLVLIALTAVKFYENWGTAASKYTRERCVLDISMRAPVSFDVPTRWSDS